MLAREALSPILLPSSELYLKTRSVVQKPVRRPTAKHLCSCFRGTFFHSLGLLLSMNY